MPVEADLAHEGVRRLEEDRHQSDVGNTTSVYSEGSDVGCEGEDNRETGRGERLSEHDSGFPFAYVVKLDGTHITNELATRIVA